MGSLIQYHIVKDEQGNGIILYKDKDGNYLLCPAKFPLNSEMGLLIQNFGIKILSDNYKD